MDRLEIRRAENGLQVEFVPQFGNSLSCELSMRLQAVGYNRWRGILERPYGDGTYYYRCDTELRLLADRIQIRGDDCREFCGARGYIHHEYRFDDLKPCS